MGWGAVEDESARRGEKAKLPPAQGVARAACTSGRPGSTRSAPAAVSSAALCVPVHTAQHGNPPAWAAAMSKGESPISSVLSARASDPAGNVSPTAR